MLVKQLFPKQTTILLRLRGFSKGTAQRALQNLPKNPTMPKNAIPREPVIGFVWAAQK
jgi:hypothetical protein